MASHSTVRAAAACTASATRELNARNRPGPFNSLVRLQLLHLQPRHPCLQLSAQ